MGLIAAGAIWSELLQLLESTKSPLGLIAAGAIWSEFLQLLQSA